MTLVSAGTSIVMNESEPMDVRERMKIDVVTLKTSLDVFFPPFEQASGSFVVCF